MCVVPSTARFIRTLYYEKCTILLLSTSSESVLVSMHMTCSRVWGKRSTHSFVYSVTHYTNGRISRCQIVGANYCLWASSERSGLALTDSQTTDRWRWRSAILRGEKEEKSKMASIWGIFPGVCIAPVNARNCRLAAVTDWGAGHCWPSERGAILTIQFSGYSTYLLIDRVIIVDWLCAKFVR